MASTPFARRATTVPQRRAAERTKSAAQVPNTIATCVDSWPSPERDALGIDDDDTLKRRGPETRPRHGESDRREWQRPSTSPRSEAVPGRASGSLRFAPSSTNSGNGATSPFCSSATNGCGLAGLVDLGPPACRARTSVSGERGSRIFLVVAHDHVPVGVGRMRPVDRALRFASIGMRRLDQMGATDSR